MRLWKIIDGVPYMVNDPRLGILALNPKRRVKKMARRKHGARHMAWVRSFRKNPKRSHHRRSYRRNPAGPVAAAMFNPRRRYRRNPGRMRAYAVKARGFFGMPPLMPIVYGAGGFVATAFINKTIFSFLPTTMTTDATTGAVSPLVKYLVLIGSVIVTSWAAKSFLGLGAAAFAGVGGGIFIVSQAAHDFAPGVVPGMGDGPGLNIGAYANVRAYSKIRGVRGTIQPANGGHQGAALGAPAFGAQMTTDSAEFGGSEIVQSRFRRFQ